jgi:hypothetical protein
MYINPRFLNGAARRRKRFKVKVLRQALRQWKYTTYDGNPADDETLPCWCEIRIDMDHRKSLSLLRFLGCFRSKGI